MNSNKVTPNKFITAGPHKNFIAGEPIPVWRNKDTGKVEVHPDYSSKSEDAEYARRFLDKLSKGQVHNLKTGKPDVIDWI